MFPSFKQNCSVNLYSNFGKIFAAYSPDLFNLEPREIVTPVPYACSMECGFGGVDGRIEKQISRQE